MKNTVFLIFVVFILNISRLESLPIDKPEIGLIDSNSHQPEVGIVSIDDSSSKKPEMVTKPWPGNKVAIGLYSSQFLDLLLQMSIFPKVEHWPLSDGRTISGTFIDQTNFQGIIHYPSDPTKPDVGGKFTNLHPFGEVNLTLIEENV
jgi:hypothetical protein